MTLIQKPNLPLLIFFGAKAVEILSSGPIHRVAAAVAVIALAGWAYMEVADGLNWARKSLGAVVLVYLVFSLAR